jgi:succinate dehydrogenase/fumarate reductase flavoprotein subunit
MKVSNIQTDVLCVGGGIAGLMAGIRSAEAGAKTLIVDKGNVKYSGAGATGNDHFQCYIPEVHGNDIDSMIEEFQTGQQATIRDIEFVRTWLGHSFDIVKLWDEWGIPMKYHGKWEFSGHGMPGDKLSHLHYAGKHQKKILMTQAKKCGAQIINRVMCFDLLRDNQGVCGAIGLHVRTGEIFIFHAKAVVLGTGSAVRLFQGPTPANLFNVRLCPNCVGDGRAMAYRAGADLASLEIPIFRCGPTYFARAGKATWAGVLRDPNGNPCGPFVTRPDIKYGDPVVDVYQDLFMRYRDNGTGPVYMDCTGLSPQEVDYMTFWLENEGNIALLEQFKAEGKYIGDTPLEFRSYDRELQPRGGVFYDEKGQTSLPGLYAAGDEFFGAISCAAVFGWLAGANAAEFSHKTSLRIPDTNLRDNNPMLEAVQRIGSRTASSGTCHWHEANRAIQQIMSDYAGLVRSESMLRAGQNGLARIGAKVHQLMAAENPHELMRCVEVLNLLEVGDLIFTTARERKETRGKHIRKDYPFTHPHLNKLLIIRRKDDKKEIEWRNVKQK